LAFWEVQLRHTDVVIAGGGLAGSLAAAMLGRAGIDAVLIDPHPVYPPDFRCEKLDRVQLQTLKLTGVADAVLRASTPDQEAWVARFGRVIEKLQATQRGVLYDTLVNTVRAQILARTHFVRAKVTEISTGRERQTVKLSNGEEISARLVVLATGLNIGLRQKLGIDREVLSPNHSISIGFDVQPTGGRTLPFSSLTYFTERPVDRMAYISVFPIGGGTMRANMFAYRDLHDPWLKQFRDAPQETLYAMWPGLRRLMGEFTVPNFVQIRPVDLYATKGYRQHGVVLVGDAFSSSCPAAGTGARKAMGDVERLCNVHIPRWLATPGMGEAKIAAYYDDPVKLACDALSIKKAFGLRSYSINRTPFWIALRWAKFLAHWGRGTLRRLAAVPATSDSGDEAQDETPAWARRTPAHKKRASAASSLLIAVPELSAAPVRFQAGEPLK
jgi:2-polyprenyl-6-methoxyphenol hydroxylase-like FAD-dependent oxidoreductase